jgi:predicted negative regulator of RcsB-dependent stress response
MAREQKRLKKKELREDPLMTAITNAQVWLAEHGKKLAVGIVVVAAVVIAVNMLSNMRMEADMESRGAFADVQLEISQTNPEDVIPLLLRVADDYAGTSGGAEALFTAAEMALNEREPARAEELFTRFISEYKDEYMLSAGAQGGLATAIEDQGRFEEAADQYLILANNEDATHYRFFALFNAGSCYASGHDYDKAREMYNLVLDEEDYSDFKTRAELELARLDVIVDHVGLP